MGIVVGILSLMLMLIGLWVFIRNNITFRLLSKSDRLIFVWLVSNDKNEFIDSKTDWYDILEKEYWKVLLNPFIWDVSQVFRKKEYYEMIMKEITPDKYNEAMSILEKYNKYVNQF